MRAAVLVGLGLLLATPAFAQQGDHPAPACAAMDASLPGGLEDWNAGGALQTAKRAKELAQATITPGKGYAATLARTVSVFMPVQPAKPGGSVSYSGLFQFTVETEGAYTVALGSAAWIDVLEDGKSLEPSSFGHGPACTTIRKMVTFALKPGLHVLQVAGNGAEAMKLMVAKAP